MLGGRHAVIHPDIPVIENNAYLVDGTHLHPGDSFTVPPAAVDVLGRALELGERRDRRTAVGGGRVVHLEQERLVGLDDERAVRSHHESAQRRAAQV